MASPKFVLYLTWLYLGKMAHMAGLSLSIQQESGFISTHVGSSVTLRCFYNSDVVARYYWYKQSFGQKPKLFSSFYVYNNNGTFYEENKNSVRFRLDTKSGQNHLIIVNVQISDSATYYCASSFSVSFELGDGVTLSVQDSGLKVPSVVHQSVSGTVHPGSSVTLNCTVHTGTCDRNHHVYWFKDSKDLAPSIIYTHGDRNDQCQRKTKTQTHTCVYNLPMKSLNQSHAGTYYCAVAACGHILFGNGTKVEFLRPANVGVVVYLLGIILAFTTILIISLSICVCISCKRDRYQCSDSDAAHSASSTKNIEGYQDVDILQYSTIAVNRDNRSRKQKENSEVLCSSIKQ